jgi:3-oxoacyl-[acyl-carrier protein] reductase
MTLKNKTVLVVGANSSIGLELVNSLELLNCNIIATVHNTTPSCFLNKPTTVLNLDLADRLSIESFSKEIHTPIDIVFFLSAILPGKSLEEYDLSLMEKVMTVNFTGQAMLLKKLIPHLSKDSQIIIMSSISADRGSYDPMYSASKAAQHGFVKSLALQLAPNTRINIISPGLVDESSMFNDMQSQTREKHLLNTPMKRLTTKKEIVGIMINLCDPAWANVTGQVIRVNGGAYV